MTELSRRFTWPDPTDMESQALLSREWLVTNGLGGYASGTVSGVITRRYHGLLVAALVAPFGRTMMLNDLVEHVQVAGSEELVQLGGEERAGGKLKLYGAAFLTEFVLEAGLPVWRYKIGDVILEKRLLLPYRQNTVHVSYRLLSTDRTVRLHLRPAVHFRPHEEPVSAPLEGPYTLNVVEDRYELSNNSPLPPLRMMMLGGDSAFTVDGKKLQEVFYRVEESRGYEARGDLWTPGYFQVDVSAAAGATLIASTESWEVILALTPEEADAAERVRRRRLVAMAHPEARSGAAAELVLAADQFIITPAGRIEDAARAHASGDEVRTVIAGYHWFTDWGRDTMISLEGLTLATGRHNEGGWILRTFAHYIRDGLIPNLFPEGEREGLYHTADATLWFFHAIHRYIEVTGDRVTLLLLLPKLRQIIDHHMRGTRFGIGVDPRDGLLRQGDENHPLTWMDARVDGWVVTPRRGKTVEINALWYNALRLLANWTAEEQGSEAAQPLADHADKVRTSFNERFWNPRTGYLYDIVDGERGDDPACRPNQLLAISLPYPVLDPDRWDPVLEAVRQQLLTPVGLRSLAPDHPDYKPQYYGDLRARDAAYHQGTVWAWLIGPYIDAWLKVHPGDRDGARALLRGLLMNLGEAGLDSISEVFDAEDPFTPRGCIAQAWSVAEALRCWINTAAEPAVVEM